MESPEAPVSCVDHAHPDPLRTSPNVGHRPSSAYGPRLAETPAVGFLRKDELTVSAVAKLVDGAR